MLHVHENSYLGKIEEIIEETPNKNIVKIKLGDKKFSTLGEMPKLSFILQKECS